MQEAVKREVGRIIDSYAEEESLNALLKQFVREKESEGTRWSDITLNAHYMLGGSSPWIFRNAAVAELMVLALDIADDLQDEDNSDKAWRACPQAFSLNAILSLLAACMGECPPDALPEICRLLAQSVNGQQQDLNGSVRTEDDYFQMVYNKSGSLLRLACRLAYSLIPELEEERLRLIDELAGTIGIIAQLENDIRDISRVDEKNDLLHRNRTLPVLFLLQDSRMEFPPLWQYFEGTLSKEELIANKAECLEYIDRSGCLEYSRVVQALYMDKAEEYYQQLEALSPWKETFRAITFAPRETKSA